MLQRTIRRGFGWALLALLSTRSALAQSASPTAEPAPDPASQRATQQQRSLTPPVADDLDVPPTLTPLSVDSDAPSTPELSTSAPPLPPPPLHFGGRGQWVMMGSSNALNISTAPYSWHWVRCVGSGDAILVDELWRCGPRWIQRRASDGCLDLAARWCGLWLSRFECQLGGWHQSTHAHPRLGRAFGAISGTPRHSLFLWCRSVSVPRIG